MRTILRDRNLERFSVFFWQAGAFVLDWETDVGSLVKRPTVFFPLTTR
jgi:hypothetical protein